MSAKPKKVGRPRKVVDADEAEFDREFGPEAKPKMGVVTRIAAKAAPNRGVRAVRSDNDRGGNSRAGNTRSGAEFTEAEIQAFMKEGEEQMPFVPDTAEYHYKWARVRLGDKDDGSNVTANLNGRMGFEVVMGPEMLPPNLKLQALSIKSGDYSGGYQYRDCMLMRCPMRNHKLAIIAASRRAKQLNEMLDAGSQAGTIPGETRTNIVVEENVERSGIREIMAEDEEEAA